MSAALTIAGKDAREFLRDRRFVIMAILTGLLALAAIATSAARVARYEADRRAAEAQDRGTWLGQGARNPHMAGHFGLWAFRPLTAAALLDPGAGPYAGAAIRLEAHVRNTPSARPVEGEGDGALFGPFSVAAMLQGVVPLLLLMIGAGLIARERERGTLRLVTASGAHASSILKGKLLTLAGIAAALAAPVLIAAVVAAGALAPDAGDGLAVLIWALCYAVFTASVLVAALCVSARARTVSSAVLLLLGGWFLAVVLVPRAGATLAEAVAPTPSASAFWSAVTAKSAQAADAAGVEDARFTAAMLRRFHVVSQDRLPVSLIGLRLDASETIGDRVYSEGFERLSRLYRRHRDVMRLTGVLSPIVPLQNISMALAGTDALHQQAFELQAEAHRERMMSLLNADFTEHAGKAAFDYLAGRNLWRRLGAFAPAPPPLLRTLGSIWPDLLILAGWCAAAFGFLMLTARRLSPEAV